MILRAVENTREKYSGRKTAILIDIFEGASRNSSFYYNRRIVPKVGCTIVVRNANTLQTKSAAKKQWK